MQRFMRVTVISLAAVFFLLIGVVILTPLVHAADETSVEAAEAVPTQDVAIEHMRAEIAAEEDPELRAAMEEQLDLLESGQLDLQTAEMLRSENGSVIPPVETGLLGPPVDTRTGGSTTRGNYLPPEAQAELEKIFSQGTGDPSKDGHLREQAEKVMEKYGIERPTFGGGGDYEGRGGGMESGGSRREAFERGGGLEQRGEGFERAMMEHMSPEAREQMERFMGERGMDTREMSYEAREMERGGMEREMMERGGGMERGGMEREMMEREFGGHSMEREFGGSSPERSYEAPTREYESTTREYESPTREYESTTREYEAPTYEAPTREYEAPTYEAPTREYEAPTHEYQAPEREYQYQGGQTAY